MRHYFVNNEIFKEMFGLYLYSLRRYREISFKEFESFFNNYFSNERGVDYELEFNAASNTYYLFDKFYDKYFANLNDDDKIKFFDNINKYNLSVLLCDCQSEMHLTGAEYVLYRTEALTKYFKR